MISEKIVVENHDNSVDDSNFCMDCLFWYLLHVRPETCSAFGLCRIDLVVKKNDRTCSSFCRKDDADENN